MRADPSAQLALLDVQALDSRLDRLRRQAAAPPEAAELAALETQHRALAGRVVDLRTAVGDLERDQRKADADVEQVKARRRRDQQRLDSGAVGTPKDLERLQQEVVSLDRRISELEDVELEVMELLEAHQIELRDAEDDLAALEARRTELTAARDERVGGLRREAAEVEGERAEAVSGLPADLLSLYDRLRASKDGVGAALLRARRCEGCSLQLDNAELATISRTPAEEVVRCEECSRILVRTAESGL